MSRTLSRWTVSCLGLCALALAYAHAGRRDLQPVTCETAAPLGSPALAQLAAAQRALGATRDNPEAWVSAGHAWIRAARRHSRPAYLQNAAACAQGALRLSADAAPAQSLLGLTYMDAHRFEEARALAQRLLARHPDDPQSWGLLSDAELELKHLDAAVAATQQMIDRKPGMLSYGRAAHLRWLTGDPQGAKQLYRMAIAAADRSVDPEPRAWLLTEAAWLFWREGDYAGAVRGFDLALASLPDYAPALAGRGRAALSAGDARSAVQFLKRACAQHETPDTLTWLNEAYAQIP